DGRASDRPVADAPDVDAILDVVHRPVLRELVHRGAPFFGLLYGGLILTERGPHVIEFNCRFGDPETQSVLPLLDGGLLGVLAAQAAGGPAGMEPPVAAGAAVPVVVASRDYPERGEAGTPIAGIDAAEPGGALVFPAGTAL